MQVQPRETGDRRILHAGKSTIIEAVAEYHGVRKSRAVELLLREGVQAREMRFRFEQLDAKLDVLSESLGGQPLAEDAGEEDGWTAGG
ncbi:hypothetical protein [Natrialba swarupiae]|uniref:hypothetical protein n=1 Tax=Natrialba swarupiae TaxID=2448032 RepID=UPI00192E3245|nr:hypothetical protein [Natrialba swarupiae]